MEEFPHITCRLPPFSVAFQTAFSNKEAWEAYIGFRVEDTQTTITDSDTFTAEVLSYKPHTNCASVPENVLGPRLPTDWTNLSQSFEKKVFLCETCGKTFKRQRQLIIHRRTHTGEKPYTCLTCKKSFNRQDHLNQHLLIHSDERPYTCQTCKKSFTRQDHLNQHLLTHSDERPYTCQTCKKSFKLKDHLKQHLLIHSDERPYTCQTCKKSFTRQENLNLHRLIHT